MKQRRTNESPGTRVLPTAVGVAAAWVFTAAVVLTPTTGRGQPAADATRYADEGREHYQKGRYAEAYESFETASRLAPADPRFGLNAALALEKLGRFEEAVERHHRARVGVTTTQLDRSSADVVDMCQRHLGSTHGVVVLSFTGGARGAAIRDNRGWGGMLPPARQSLCLRTGSHRIAGYFVNAPNSESTVIVSPAVLGAAPIQVTVAPAPVESTTDLATPGWITLGVGTAAMVVGGIVAALGDSDLQDANKLEYAGDPSNEVARASFLASRSDAQSDALNQRTAGWVTFGVGAGAAVTGAVLLIIDSTKSSDGRPAGQAAFSGAPFWDGVSTGARLTWVF